MGLAAALLGVSFVAANKMIAGFEEASLLEEITGGNRSRIVRYTPYLAPFDDPPPADGAIEERDDTPIQSTAAHDRHV